MKFWKQTLTGAPIDFVTPLPEQVDLRTIAHSLGMLCRWVGHTRRFFSVASHSMLVMDYVRLLGGEREAQRAALFHDAHEAYTGDIPTPVKDYLTRLEHDELGFEPFEPNLAFLQRKLQAAIEERFSITAAPHQALVHRADAWALWTERAALLAPSQRAWDPEPARPPVVIDLLDLTHFEARDAFLACAAELGIQ